MQLNLGLEQPTVKLPCDRFINLPLSMIAMLRSAGVSTLELEGCQCGEKHQVELPDTQVVRCRITTSNLLVAQNGNNPAGWK